VFVASGFSRKTDPRSPIPGKDHPMRRLRYVSFMSLDGYIAGPKEEFDWIPNDPDVLSAEIFEMFDTLVMGRKTFEQRNQHYSY
jgi:hypothetical protein